MHCTDLWKPWNAALLAGLCSKLRGHTVACGPQGPLGMDGIEKLMSQTSAVGIQNSEVRTLISHPDVTQTVIFRPSIPAAEGGTLCLSGRATGKIFPRAADSQLQAFRVMVQLLRSEACQ